MLRACSHSRWITLALLLLTELAAAQITVTRGESLSVDVSDERQEILFSLFGDLWTVPASSGVARRLAEAVVAAQRPRWSPDSTQVAFETGRAGRREIWLLDVASGRQSQVATAGGNGTQPAWHPSGERLAYASDAYGRSLDIWETDLATGLAWRLTSDPGEESEPAWSADGRDLVYIAYENERWRLMLRRFGEPPRALTTSETPLYAPSWRPDGTLVTYFAANQDRAELRMVILSDPPLERRYSGETALFPTPVSWLDRNRLYYSVGDRIMTRNFGDWAGRIVPFRASVTSEAMPSAFTAAERDIPLVDPAPGRLVVRAGRLFDGFSRSYRSGADVLIDNGEIVDVTATKDWAEVPVIELPTTTMVPGYIDAYARLPEAGLQDLGAQLLAWGVTTVVAERPTTFDPDAWEGDDTPGPRLLNAASLSADDMRAESAETEWPYLVIADGAIDDSVEQRAAVAHWLARGVPVLAANWQLAGTLGTPLLTAADSARVAPSRTLGTARSSGANQRFDLATHRLVSGLADRHTTGLKSLLQSRQAGTLTARAMPNGERVPLLDDLRRARLPVTVGTAPNGLPPGLALHAELLALHQARLAGDQVLGGVGRHAAALLGLSGRLGEITVGARADLVLLDGDPLANPNDARNIVAVIRNGRFYSLVNLLDRLQQGVE